MNEFIDFIMKRLREAREHGEEIEVGELVKIAVNASRHAREAHKERLREANQGLRVLAQEVENFASELEVPSEPPKPKMPTPKEIAKFLPPVPEMRPTVYGYCPRCSVTVDVSVREGCCTVCGGPLRGL
jgi:hypothetical protein